MKMAKIYTTYAQLYEFGKPVGKKYIVRIDAESEAQAIRKAKAYHTTWSRAAKRRGGYSAKYVGIKRKKTTKKLKTTPTYFQQINRIFR